MLTKEQASWFAKLRGGAAAGSVKAGPSPPGSDMLPDCKPVKGKVPGPAQHLLCATHGHILDIKEKKIIAISLDQYKSKKMGSAKPAQAATPAQATPPPGPSTAIAAPAPAPASGTPPPPDADAAKARAEVTKILAQLQSETEDFDGVRAQHEVIAGGGRLNRGISWISDKLGGADDPGDELAEIGNKVMLEHLAGMAAVGSMNLDAANKHLATIKAFNEQAHRLLQKYTGDTVKGGERAVTGLTIVSEAGEVATAGLNVLAPGAGKILSVAKNASVTVSKLAFGEKVNWTEFTVDMAFDLFVGKEGGQINKAAEKFAGPFAKKLAPKLSEAIAKKLGGKVTEDVIEKYIKTEAEELIKDHVKDLVTPIAEHVVESAKDTEITHQQLVDLMLKSMTDPSGSLAKSLSDKLMADLKP